MSEYLTLTIPTRMAGYRLDKALSELFPSYSRARLQQWLREGYILVNAVSWRGKDKIQGGEVVQLTVQLHEEVSWQAQKLPLTILYEDEDLLVINKPVGVIVHPGAGHQDNTLVNALLHDVPELVNLPRAGMIHRLDKDTSGLLVVARSLKAHTSLVDQLQNRQFIREYQAIVTGVLIAGGTIEAPIGRHPVHRTRMAVVPEGKPAITHYRVLQRYRAHTHLLVRLETGRTHQIRVHLAHQRYPLVGDGTYGGRPRIPPKSSEHFKSLLLSFKHQALHAQKLGFIHPRTQKLMIWEAPLPEDMQNLLLALKEDQHA